MGSQDHLVQLLITMRVEVSVLVNGNIDIKGNRISKRPFLINDVVMKAVNPFPLHCDMWIAQHGTWEHKHATLNASRMHVQCTSSSPIRPGDSCLQGFTGYPARACFNVTLM